MFPSRSAAAKIFRTATRMWPMSLRSTVNYFSCRCQMPSSFASRIKRVSVISVSVGFMDEPAGRLPPDLSPYPTRHTPRMHLLLIWCYLLLLLLLSLIFQIFRQWPTATGLLHSLCTSVTPHFNSTLSLLEITECSCVLWHRWLGFCHQSECQAFCGSEEPTIYHRGQDQPWKLQIQNGVCGYTAALSAFTGGCQILPNKIACT